MSEENGDDFNNDQPIQPEIDNSPEQSNIGVELNPDQDEIIKSEMEFNSLALLTLWLFPLMISSLYLRIPGFWQLSILSVVIYKAFLENRNIPVLTSTVNSVSGFFFKLSKMSSVATEMSDDPQSIRLWYFLTIGTVINTFIGFVLLTNPITIFIIWIILAKRKSFIRYMYILTYSPRREYVFITSQDDREKKRKMKDELSQKQKGYYYFKKPRKMTSFVGYLLIFLTPFALVLVLVPVIAVTAFASFDNIPSDFFQQVVTGALQFAVLGLIAVIPFIILDLPIWRSHKLTQWSTYRLAPRVITALSTNKFSFGFFSGEYYIEEDSMMLDMSESTGFFSIFKNGRFFSIIVTPLAFISILFRFILQTVNIEDTSNIKTAAFLDTFLKSINILNNTGSSQITGIVFIGLLILGPIILSIILPLIWVISDSELKRASWTYNEIEEGYNYEISDVENVGKSLLNTFKIVLGVGAISSLATNISIILTNTSAVSGWLITAVIVIIGAVITLPGTFYMAYRYLASGIHAKGVNIIRFSGSQLPKIGVGTISRNYKLEYKLLDPPDEIRELIGKREMDKLAPVVVTDEGIPAKEL